MGRWWRLLRGMLGTGLVFAGGVGSIAGAIAGVLWALPGIDVGVEVFRLAAASAIWSFPIGVAFSGFLALTARGRSFDALSMPRFIALGVAGGAALFGVLALNAWDAWTLANAIGNFVIFATLGGGSAGAALFLARKAQPALGAVDDDGAGRRLDAGEAPSEALEGPAPG